MLIDCNGPRNTEVMEQPERQGQLHDDDGDDEERADSAGC